MTIERGGGGMGMREHEEFHPKKRIARKKNK
jgi:hypothetical protein